MCLVTHPLVFIPYSIIHSQAPTWHTTQRQLTRQKVLSPCKVVMLICHKIMSSGQQPRLDPLKQGVGGLCLSRSQHPRSFCSEMFKINTQNNPDVPVGGLLMRILEEKKEEVRGQLQLVQKSIFMTDFSSHIENSIFLQSIMLSLFSGCL